MGRPPKPKHIKLLEGERKDRVNWQEPIPALQPVEPPYRLTKAVQAEWDRLAGDRIAKQVLTAWDVDAFALFCELLVLNRKAVKAARRGILVEGARRGEKVYNRSLQAVRETTQLLTTLGARFGWTPSDRAQLTMLPDDDDDLLSSILDG
jgi:P27 family predicted phage terminase small subunit